MGKQIGIGGEESRSPIHNYNRCFYCQEICLEGAISVKEPLLRRTFSGDKGTDWGTMK